MSKAKQTAKATAPPLSAEETFPLHSPPAKKITKTDGIRQALAAGISKPKDVVEWVKANYGLTVQPNVVSTTRYMLAKKAATQVHVVNRNGKKPAGPTPTGTTLDLVRTMKSLMAQYGAEAVREVVDLWSE